MTIPPPAPAPSTPPTVDHTTIVAKYVALRDKVADIKKRHAAELQPYAEAMATIDAYLLDHLNSTGAQSIKTSAGTFFRDTRESFRVADPATFRQFCVDTGNLDLLETRLSKSSLEMLLGSGQPMPPGVAVHREVTVKVHRS